MAAAPKGKNQSSLFNKVLPGLASFGNKIKSIGQRDDSKQDESALSMNFLLKQARISFEKWIDIENPKDYPMPRGIVFLQSVKASFGVGEEVGDGIVLYRLTDEQIKDKENEIAKNKEKEKEKEKEKLANDKNKDNDNDTIMENEKEGVKDSGNVNNENENDKMNEENEEKKNDDNNNKIENNKWSGPCAIRSGGISFGFQIGISTIDHIIMLPTERHVRTFTSKSQFKWGASTELAVANVGGQAQRSVCIGQKETSEIQSFSLDAKGLSIGVSVEGSVIIVRDDFNSEFYGKKVSVEDIAYGRVNMSDVSKENEDYKRIIELLNKHFTIFRPDPPAAAHHHHGGPPPPPPPHDGAPPPVVGPIVGGVVGAALAGPGPHRGGPHGGPHGSSTFYADGRQRTWNVNYASSIYAQIGGTCYAHAVASAIRATESRIVGRISDSHQSIVNDIISRHGCGAVTKYVLKEECDKRQLKCKTVDFDGALNALLNGDRVVVARFDLTKKQWKNFSSYFGDHSDGVLTKSKLGESDGSETGGHAACITGANKDGKYWKIKNAWGNHFADNGYFRVEYNALNFTYYDVYFRQCDLTQKDWDNYKQ